MTESSNNRELVGILGKIAEDIENLLQESRDQSVLLRTIDWKLWEQMKISKSFAHNQNIEIFEPEELDKPVE